MGYYPILLDVTAKPVLLVGGGNVAHEKMSRLVDAEADVTVVAPALIPAVQEYIDGGRVRWIARAFEAGDTTGYFLVMIATDDGEVNRTIADEARAHGTLVNAADDAANCDFVLPSLVKRGDIQIASSTGGTSPAMARWLREQLEDFLSDEVVALHEVLASVRRELREDDRICASRCTRAKTPPPLLCPECPNRIPGDRWQDAVDNELMTLIRNDRLEAARERVRRSLGRETLQPAPWWRSDEPQRMEHSA
jgi:precorrin-2 dehydrogenase / sirohydrochlorin ferrochelatase